MERSVVQIFGETIEVVVSSDDSNNTCCVCIQTSPPGGGPPPHKHDREEEVFHVLEGTYEFYNDGKWEPFERGETRFSPRGTYHAFRNSGSAVGRMLFYTNAGGLDKYFNLISALRLPEDMAKLAEISDHFGYSFLQTDRG
jgi:quercetin dioxygenase-like cupin family protein